MGFVTGFGPVLSLFFVDPDGIEGEVCVPNPNTQPGVFQPAWHPLRRLRTRQLTRTAGWGCRS